MEIFEALIEELNQAVLTAKKAPLSSQDIVVNGQKMLALVEKFKANFPVVIREANSIVHERDYIRQSAETYANQLMNEAESKAQQMISQTDIVQKAQERANKITKDAEDYYTKLEYEARLVSFNILKDVNMQLSNGLETVQRNMQELQQTRPVKV